MLPPASRRHDGGDGCALGLSEQGEDCLLLGSATGRCRGEAMITGFACLFVGLPARVNVIFSEVLRCDILRILSGCDGSAPSPPKPHSGGVASGAGSGNQALWPLSRHDPVTLSSPRESTRFCDEIVR
jgi:hypothetical protein